MLYTANYTRVLIIWLLHTSHLVFSSARQLLLSVLAQYISIHTQIIICNLCAKDCM